MKESVKKKHACKLLWCGIISSCLRLGCCSLRMILRRDILFVVNKTLSCALNHGYMFRPVDGSQLESTHVAVNKLIKICFMCD